MSYVDEVLERVKTKNAAEPEFLRPAGCMQHIRKCERCVHKKGVKNNAEK